ncbi:ABC transporter ATP-binding protein [Clostridium botulinum]|uniref:Bacitracin ABC transporter ATP-binding protein n=1 Tax=Clostridium botulinum C/D str. DC5 TaxID=1443128 RepID=A0A0A0IEN6_CLOBO|nr:ABC transporter ATP-binding protein [Clostridium botulinum]KEI01163.1 bacitracin ABC transporter ATP-binding protein [Clostridium botulinum C/D str. BKT75002]KEI13358.1 bacitracin ABC transporter ATP-binding protein [Clostridium botulinum C/D str. BKT2873]KGM98478.1 bacitracin ABC transporter ATP-binding protein [Clostridium botulinum D str. CCUG 7971]KGM98711.1 bacitracin ABC transporter ATP-binding protein [Clostridium botulinum C/D str. DC5]KOC47158.1 bacitracin ABC transporter ATP-bindi
MNVLEVKDVKKRLSKRDIIKGISFEVKEGEIFGFLGPNGAGKTTTIRMLVGLIAPNSGNIVINGHDISKEREKALRAVGAVVENPELYTYLSGRENLMQIARVRKIGKQYVNKIIELVGLRERIDDKVKKYSLGMKQRLGLAASLITKPKLLILDEPTNGLDPTGIIEFRKIVKKVAKETNAAVFISSHILSEIQVMCDKVAFINNGIIQSVESIHGDVVNKDFENIVLCVRNKKECEKELNRFEFVSNITFKDELFKMRIKKGSVPKLVFELVKQGIEIEEVYKSHAELEDRYIELVEGGKR